MNIYLIRHADPDYHNDTLTDLGFDQARKLGEYFRDIPLTAVYCSPMGRAKDTMAAVLDGRAIRPKILEWLHEMEGRFDGGDLWAWNLTAQDFVADPGIPERVETFMADQQGAAVRAFHDLMAEHGYRRNGSIYDVLDADRREPAIALFAHAGLILTLLSGLFDWPLASVYATLGCPPTAITHLVMTRGQEAAALRLRALAGRPHLPPRENLGIAQ